MNILDNVDIQEVKQKLYDRLKPSGWGDKLKTFILSDDFDKILNYLLQQAKAGNRFTPGIKQVFSAFEDCPYNNLKVIMLGQDPYPSILGKITTADGKAFSCSNLGHIQPSLKYIFKEIENTVCKDGYTWDPDLKRWSNQGILLLNSALTTRVNEVGKHYEIWKPFISFLFDMLNCNNPNLIYVFMGKKAQEWMDEVNDNSHKIITSHPASAAHNHLEHWDSGDMFAKVNEILKKQYNEQIIW